MRTYDPRAVKCPVNLSLNGDLVAKAREAGLNLSSIAEDAVAIALARQTRQQWDMAITEACAAHDRYLEQYGSLSELLRAQEQEDGAG